MLSYSYQMWSNGTIVLKRLLNLLAGTMLLLMMLLTAIDVLGRYLFNTPLVGSSELIEIMLAASIFLILPTITWQQEHVSVDLIEGALPLWLRTFRNRTYHLLMTIGCTYMAMTVWKLAERAARYQSVSEYLAIPSAYSMYLISICLGLTAITFLVMTLLGDPKLRTFHSDKTAQEVATL